MASGCDVDLDRVINELKSRLGKDWKKVARELNFSRTDIHAIEVREMLDLREQIHLFFERWKMHEGKCASVQKLLDAVKAVGLQAILDELREALPGLRRGEGSVNPVQETTPTSPITPTRNSDLEHIRKKRLDRLSSNESDKLKSSECTVLRSASATSNSSTISEEMSTTVTDSSPSTRRSISGEAAAQFEVGNVVTVDRKPKPWHGVIKWIGNVANVQCAGIEMDDIVDGGHSGKYEGKRYFTCDDGHGVFLPMTTLRPDDRFDPPPLKGGAMPSGEAAEKDQHMLSSSVPSVSSPTAVPASPDPLASSPRSTQKDPEIPTAPAINIKGVTAASGGGLYFECPGDVAGFIIGKDGKNLRDVESKTKTVINVDKNELDKTANTKVLICGEQENCQKALRLIVQNIHRKTAIHTSTTETIMIPTQHYGRVIGRRGANIQAIQNLTGTRIEVHRRKGLDALINPDSPCEITGSADDIERAKEMIEMSVKGSDIAQATVIAEFMVKFMEQLKAEGHTSAS